MQGRYLADRDATILISFGTSFLSDAEWIMKMLKAVA
jgi:hypothetical protein